MSTGIGNLPYTMPPVSPFDVITSQAENERIANIKSLADGTGIGDSAVTSDKVDWTTVQTAQTGWTTPTLQNGWVYNGAPYNTPAYRKDLDGVVHLKGMVRSGTSTQPIFTLPPGFRPPATVYLAAPNGGATAEVGILMILANGEIRNGTGSNTYQSLDNISFKPA